MLSYRTSARHFWVTWLTLVAGVTLMVAPFIAVPPPGAGATWACLATGGLFVLGALAALIANPTWGSEVSGRNLTWWHEAKRLQRTVSVDELRAVHVMREADVAQLEFATRSVSLPRECLHQDAAQWAQALHAQFPHIELHVD
jgi:hypothetical protein